jgi:hypothetical protein
MKNFFVIRKLKKKCKKKGVKNKNLLSQFNLIYFIFQARSLNLYI